MQAALGIVGEDQDQDKLTPAEMQALLKKVRGCKEEVKVESSATGLGFDKMKVEIRARPGTKVENPHRLDGNF